MCSKNLILILSCVILSWEKTSFGVVADETESIGAHSLGLAGGGVAALNDQSSVRANPAMLASSKSYRLAGTYYWPSYGRRFYQVGVVDGTNRKISAGLIYTSFPEKFVDPYASSLSKEEKVDAFYGSKVDKKISLGFAGTVGKVALGLSATHVEGHVQSEQGYQFSQRDGLTIGLGCALLLRKNIRVGASINNLNNVGVADLNPEMRRAHIAFLMDGGKVSLHGDYSERDRTKFEVGSVNTLSEVLEGQTDSLHSEIEDLRSEKLLRVSGSVLLRDFFRAYAGYGKEIQTGDRSIFGAGLALVSDGYTLSYQVSNPYLKSDKSKQAIALAIDMKM